MIGLPGGGGLPRPPREPDPAEPQRRRRRVNQLALALCVGALLVPPPLNFTLLAAAAIVSSVIRATVRGMRAGRAGRQPGREPVVELGVAGRRPVVLHADQLGAHGLILGASGSGKSTTLLKLLTAQIARGGPVVALDLKGSPEFATQLQAAAAAAGRPFRVWSPDGGAHWNPLQYGNATELKDKLIATERFTEPHYKRAAERYLQRALQALSEAHPDRAPSLGEVVSMLEPARLTKLARELAPTRGAALAEYVSTLTSDQLSAVRGLGTRLAIISESHTGPFLEPGPPRETVDLRAALNGSEVVLFSLNSSRYGNLAAQLGTLAVQDLVAAAGARPEGSPTAIVAIDEFSALGSDNVLQLLARGRGFGISVFLSTQELADLERAGRGLTDQVLGNTDLTLAHRQDVPASADVVSRLAGTFKDWERVYRDGAGMFSRPQDQIGSRRVVDRRLVEPNTIMHLRRGQLLLISRTPDPRAALVQVTPPAPAAAPPATDASPALLPPAPALSQPRGLGRGGPATTREAPRARRAPRRERDGPER
jgi:conjugal transfer pilus assembly protein TraD